MKAANFRYLGEWKMTTGAAWRKWEVAALEACQACAAYHEDEVAEARFARRIATEAEARPPDVPTARRR